MVYNKPTHHPELLPLPLADLDRVDGMNSGDSWINLRPLIASMAISGLELSDVGAALAHRWEPPVSGDTSTQR
jgi:hypothetical protein